MSNIILVGKDRYEALVAVTEEEHAQGLMYKKPPVPNMLFPFEKAAVRKFWMTNTPAPLDIVFCRANRVVSIEEGIPFSMKLVGPDIETDLVIEFPRGTFKYAIGTPVSVKYDRNTRERVFRATIAGSKESLSS